MYRFFRSGGNGEELCHYIETTRTLDSPELRILRWLLAETFEPELLAERSFIKDGVLVYETGPRLSFQTPFSTNAVSICRACGLDSITRIERSRRTPSEQTFDRMTEMVYPAPLESFGVTAAPELVGIVPVLEKGPDALREISRTMGLGMDEADIAIYHRLFAEVLGRNPTTAECFQIGQANSEHCRHWKFRGQIVIDGQTMPETLFGLVRTTLARHPSGSVIAFSDNSSAIEGWRTTSLVPRRPGEASQFMEVPWFTHIAFTAETHNFPTGVAPFPGAQTGSGGRIRDVQATGRGALVGAGTAGYCVGSLNLPDHAIPGEPEHPRHPNTLASPTDIFIRGSDGLSAYGNEFGEPVVAGFCRSFDQSVPGGRRAWLKPILFTGGLGFIRHEHTKKGEPERDMLVVQIGGPAYRIGMGGGSASSMIQGQNRAELDWNAVQRGDAEMENKMNRVVRACVEMGDQNPIVSIHDQGAGGPCNVVTELVNPAGAAVDIRQIRSGDPTLSVVELWGAEYQERLALLIRSQDIARFRAVCNRERVHCEMLGGITGNGRIVVQDNLNPDHPPAVDLPLAEILGELPQKVYRVERLEQERVPLSIPGHPIAQHLECVFRLPSVGSKGFLVRKVDRSVSGLVACQQSCGPAQLPVADAAIIAANMLEKRPPGAATAIGEQPIKMLVDIRAGARMAVGEAVTNLAAAAVRGGLTHVKSSANEMWAANQKGELANLYDAVEAMSRIMTDLGIAIDGGKDSLSMAAKVGPDVVKAPGQIVVSLYAAMEDATRFSTPDLKRAGGSTLLFIDLAHGKHRLGGSALAQAYGQIGDECPDVEDPPLLVRAFDAVQRLIRDGFAESYHDRSDGGLLTTVAEMAMAGGSGATITVPPDADPVAYLFNEELGMVVECPNDRMAEARNILAQFDVPCVELGISQCIDTLEIRQGRDIIFTEKIARLIEQWEATSDALETRQMNPSVAKEQAMNHGRRMRPHYRLSYNPERLRNLAPRKPAVAIIREEGSNGDREMAAAFHLAGFESWDITMTDLVTSNDPSFLDGFRGIAFVGGFSYADVLDSAKGWAAVIRFNPILGDMFHRFFNRPSTFSLGVCNGCQLMALLGAIPVPGIEETLQPRFIRNTSGRFESRWSTVRILESPSIMLRGMAGSVLGVPVAHGEGRLRCDQSTLKEITRRCLAPIVFTDDRGDATEEYPMNPNGSPGGITALCTPDGRHLCMMPHPERAVQLWQWQYLPKVWRGLAVSPWLTMFQNARAWCDETV